MGDQASVYSRPSAPSIFGEDGKLSSASAATALKYAKPQDLPSYPSTGGVHLSSAGAAASLASSNHKSFEHWKPDAIPAANKAATLAKDYTMQPLWQPESTKAGSKAANTAHANPIEVEPMQPKRAPNPKQSTPAYDTPANSRSKALMAANSVVNRQRAGSMPTQQPPKQKEDSSWALKAATKSHKDGPSTVSAPFAGGDPGFEAARIQNAAKDNATRQLYTSTPPVSIEVQEKNRQDTLKASAVAMARKMYAIQQQHIDEASGRSSVAKTRTRGSTIGDSRSASDDLNVSAGGYENLEEAARRLAQERLAKIHDEHAEYRNYYGAQPSPPPRSRLSVRLRRRASENARDARDDDSDEEQSRRIRSQMSIFQSKLAEVDSKKRQQDRDALLVIAHRNVDAQISKLDERVFQETGKASPAQMEKWQRAAREKAQRDSDERMVNTGKVHIGAGKYIDQSELDAIAKARLQPTLDDIADKAEKQRARDEEERLDKARKEQQVQTEKTRAAAIAAETRAANEKVKAEERLRRDTEKRAQKEAAAAEKQRRRDVVAADRERERQEKEEQRARDLTETFGEDNEAAEDKPEKPGRLASLFSRGSFRPSTAAAATTTTAAAESTPAERDEDEDADESESDRGEVAEGEPTFHDRATVTPDVSADTRSPVLSDEPKVETATAEPTTVEKVTSQENKNALAEDKEEPTSPSKTRSRVKSWMKVRFRSKSGAQKDSAAIPAVMDQSGDEPKEVKTEAENGAETADTGTTDADAKVEQTSRPESMRDVAMAGRNSHESDDLYGPPRDVSPPGSKASKGSHQKVSRDRSGSISSLSSHYSEETKDRKSEEAIIEEAKVVEIKPQTSNEPAESDGDQRGRSGFKARLLRKITPNKTATKDDKAMTPVTSNATNEEYEEARDTFEEGKSAPLASSTGENVGNDGGEKATNPRTSHDKSRFTEDL